MGNPTNGGSATDGDDSVVTDKENAGDSSGGDNQKQGDQAPKMVSWETYQRAMNDVSKFKGQARDAQKKLGDKEAETLREKEDFKGLAEREKARAEQAERERDEVKGWAHNSIKFDSVAQEAQKAGLSPNALEDLGLLDLEGVDVEVVKSPKGNRLQVSGAKEFVENLKKAKPHWFAQPKDASKPAINSGGGGAAPAGEKKVTEQDVLLAEKAWKRGKKTRDEYLAVLKTYDEQKAKAKAKK